MVLVDPECYGESLIMIEVSCDLAGLGRVWGFRVLGLFWVCGFRVLDPGGSRLCGCWLRALGLFFRFI